MADSADRSQPIGIRADQTARALAALPAAGAWDTAPLELYVPEFDNGLLYFRYTRGGAAGGFEWKIEVSELTSGTVWYQTGVYQGGNVVALADTTSGVQREIFRYGATSANEELFVYPLHLAGSCERIRITAREYGNTGAPGTLGIKLNSK